MPGPRVSCSGLLPDSGAPGMSAVCCSPGVHTLAAEDVDVPWWKDPAVLIPVFSGVAFLTGVICGWSGADVVALVLFWAALLLGASTFVPGALRPLLTQGGVV